MKNTYISFNYGELKLPIDALNDCHHQGSCDEDCEYWVDKIDWDAQTMGSDAIRMELSEYGAWDDEELANDDENKLRILWISAGNYHDEIEA